ncbi:uncharacterized protein LOC116698846 [Etheostoma spectabile]|uniref:uncharacterized protein LOC116698846 n=1 Tax=Etheostoma spectabile TaxID=54343 RepID=UPI0013AF413A|nr:uncharacterized protein LOC116698846 [Etheostoma spectabile]
MEEVFETVSVMRPCYNALQRTDLCNNICRFSNSFNNCWMNATLQAALHLNVVRNTLTHQRPESLILLSSTPTFAGLFLEALRNPGRSFSPTELYGALTELSEKVPSLCLLQRNDPLKLLKHLWVWLNRCGIKTLTEVQGRGWCDNCGTSWGTSSNIYFLPLPRRGNSFSLFQQAVKQNTGPCETCGDIVQKQKVWNDPDIVTLFLSQGARTGSVLGKSVTPLQVIEFPVGENQTQLYSLSSVICHSGNEPPTGHIWSYLCSDFITIKACDSRISVASEYMRDDIYRHGIIFLYEKVHESSRHHW